MAAKNTHSKATNRGSAFVLLLEEMNGLGWELERVVWGWIVVGRFRFFSGFQGRFWGIYGKCGVVVGTEGKYGTVELVDE